VRRATLVDDRPHEASPHLNLATSDIVARLPVVLAGGFNRWREGVGVLGRRDRRVTSGTWRSDASGTEPSAHAAARGDSNPHPYNAVTPQPFA
jgi:hypothetical protein